MFTLHNLFSFCYIICYISILHNLNPRSVIIRGYNKCLTNLKKFNQSFFQVDLEFWEHSSWTILLRLKYQRKKVMHYTVFLYDKTNTTSDLITACRLHLSHYLKYFMLSVTVFEVKWVKWMIDSITKKNEYPRKRPINPPAIKNKCSFTLH